MKAKRIGHNYLHSHPNMERTLNVDAEHVIVDRKEWNEVVTYFFKNPEIVKELGKEEQK